MGEVLRARSFLVWVKIVTIYWGQPEKEQNVGLKLKDGRQTEVGGY